MKSTWKGHTDRLEKFVNEVSYHNDEVQLNVDRFDFICTGVESLRL